MRERGMKSYALIDGKMVKFAQRAKYEAWFREEMLSRDRPYDPSELFTSEQVFAHLVKHRKLRELRAKITRKRK